MELINAGLSMKDVNRKIRTVGRRPRLFIGIELTIIAVFVGGKDDDDCDTYRDLHIYIQQIMSTL